MAEANCEDCLNPTNEVSNHYTNEPKKILADSLCNDCEKYLCLNCITKHTAHLTFSVKDKTNKTKLGQFSAEITKQVESEGDQILAKFTQERAHLCDVLYLNDVDDRALKKIQICILRESKNWVITDWINKSIKIYNINNNQMAVLQNLEHEPYGITEIPSTDPTVSRIAVSFSWFKRIDIIKIHSKRIQVTSSINVEDECFDLAYCKNKLITLCMDYHDGKWRESIHVMNMTGEIIRIIDLKDLLYIPNSVVSMSVHAESETIYVFQDKSPACVTSLSIDGRVIHSVECSDVIPRHVCVDKDQTVYMIGDDFPLYKLSSDLSQKEKVIDEGFVYKQTPHSYYFTAIACHADTFYIVRSDGRVDVIRHE